MTAQLYIVEVEDHCSRPLAGHDGCRYRSPPQSAADALQLARVLLGHPQHTLRLDEARRQHAIAGGRRIVTLQAAHGNAD